MHQSEKETTELKQKLKQIDWENQELKKKATKSRYSKWNTIQNSRKRKSIETAKGSRS